MRTKSNIARRNKSIGRDFQKEVRDLILHETQLFHPELEEDDIRSNPMGAGGEDLLLSPQMRRVLLDTQHECKSKAKCSISTLMKQAIAHGDRKPVLWSKKSGKGNPIYVTIDYNFFLDLILNYKR